MTDIAISVIVPVYNTSKYLKKCLDSLKNQTLDNIEIIVIDDGSTDHSGEICDNYLNDSRFRIYHRKNTGLSGARNYGIAESRGKYIMFVDSDDWVEHDFCKYMYKQAVDRNSDYIISGNYNEAKAGSKIRLPLGKEYIFYSGYDYFKNIVVSTLGLVDDKLKNPAKLDNLTPVWARLYSNQIIKKNKIKFIDTKMLPSEALQFNFEYCVNAKNAVYVPRAFYHYRRNTEGSITKSYKDDLWSKWMWWINYENEYLHNIQANEILFEAFYSRICCSVIPLGGNAVKLSNKSAEKKEISSFLNQPIYN